MVAGTQVLGLFAAAFSVALAESWLGNGAARTQTGPRMGYQYCKRWLNPQYHNAKPGSIFQCGYVHRTSELFGAEEEAQCNL